MKTNLIIQGKDGFGLKEYKHYPVVDGDKDMLNTKDDVYEIVTINHTPASRTKPVTSSTIDHAHNKDEIIDWDMSHKNIYEVAMEDLVDWCANMMEVSETILSIRKMKKKIKGKKIILHVNDLRKWRNWEAKSGWSKVT